MCKKTRSQTQFVSKDITTGLGARSHLLRFFLSSPVSIWDVQAGMSWPRRLHAWRALCHQEQIITNLDVMHPVVFAGPSWDFLAKTAQTQARERLSHWGSLTPPARRLNAAYKLVQHTLLLESSAILDCYIFFSKNMKQIKKKKKWRGAEEWDGTQKIQNPTHSTSHLYWRKKRKKRFSFIIVKLATQQQEKKSYGY